jgi:DnaJ-class molecular chaperone
MNIISFCQKCNGTGKIPVGQSTIPCNRCGGDGRTITGYCDSSEMDGEISSIRDVVSKILEIVDKDKPK